MPSPSDGRPDADLDASLDNLAVGLVNPGNVVMAFTGGADSAFVGVDPVGLRLASTRELLADTEHYREGSRGERDARSSPARARAKPTGASRAMR